MTAPTSTRDAEHRARRSRALDGMVRGGLVGYGLVHFLVAWLAVRLVRTPDRGRVTGRGALAELAGGTSGRVTLLALAVGFAALLVWQLIAAAVGYHDHDRPRRVFERLAALCRAAMWAYLTFLAAQVALESDPGHGSSHRATATVMSWPAGVWLVGGIGGVVAAVGVGLVVFGSRVGFLGQLDEAARSHGRRRVPIVLLGQVGYVTKGIALVVIGALLVWAAITHDPRKPGGLDRSLREVLGGGPGSVAIVAIAVGLACFGLFLIARAWHLNKDSLTS